jgi:hypothetical protein
MPTANRNIPDPGMIRRLKDQRTESRDSIRKSHVPRRVRREARLTSGSGKGNP